MNKILFSFLLFLSLVPAQAFSNMIYPHGDVSCNFKTDIIDLTMMIDDMIKGNNMRWYYDVNEDYRIDIEDVTCLIDYLLSGKWNIIPTPAPEIPDSAEVFTVNGVTFAMLPVEGCESWAISENTVISLRDYYMGQTEVTYALWEAVMGEPRLTTSMDFYPENPQYPIDNASWFDCREFITRLNELTGRRFHMPTMAQWLWAAKGGKYTHDYQFSGSNNLDEVGWYLDNHPYDDYSATSFPVGMKAPNELGLYDMSGNVWEWCRNKLLTDEDELPDISEDNEPYIQGYLWGGTTTSDYLRCTTNSAYVDYRCRQGRFFGIRLALQKENQ